MERPFKENVTRYGAALPNRKCGRSHLCTSPPRQGLADYLDGYHNQVNICLENEVAAAANPAPPLRCGDDLWSPL